MKGKILALAMIMAIAALAGCNSNDGDIGEMYGVWVMESITVGGQQVPKEEAERYSWRFQSSVVQITEQMPKHDYLQCTGTWSMADGMLTLDFRHKPGGNLPAGMGLPAYEATTLRVAELSGSRMRVSYAGDKGVVEYRLKKIN